MPQVANKELYKALLLLMVAILLSNSLTVFYFSELIGDDELWYSMVKEGKLVNTARTPLGFLLEWPLWNMMVTQPNLTHLFYILAFMVPLSFCFYYLYRRYFGLQPSAAFVAAVLPNIVPGMYLLPAYTNGSYIIYLSLAGVIGVLTGLRFIEKEGSKEKVAYYLISVSLYLLFSLASELAVMLCLPYILIFILCFGVNKKTIIMSTSYASIGAYTVIRTLYMGSAGSSVNIYSLEEMYTRFKSSFSFLMPFHYPNQWFVAVLAIFIILSLTSLVYYIKSDGKHAAYGKERAVMPENNRMYITSMYIFAVIWLLSASLFTLVSHWFEARYFYMAAFPFALLLVLAAYPVFSVLSSIDRRLMIAALIIVITSSGALRNLNYYHQQKAAKEYGDVYFKVLQAMSIPAESQLFIIDEKRQHKGVWQYNTAFIRYHSDRKDLSGHIGDKDFNYDNPFVGTRSWSVDSFLRALEYKQPVFVYKVVREENSFKQYRYILKWDKPERNSSWVIIELDQASGAMRELKSGSGWVEYIDALESLERNAINPGSIAFAGFPTKNTIERLGLSDNDLGMLTERLN